MNPFDKDNSTLYSMKIKEQTRKLATGCSKHNFEAADKTDEGKVKLTWFEEIFDEYYYKKDLVLLLTKPNLFYYSRNESFHVFSHTR